MAERIVSPGVFTRENNLSFLPAGIQAIGAAIVGPTPFGQAFVPTVVTSYDEYKQKFGASDGNSYVPYAVSEYLSNGDSATIVKILGEQGYRNSSTIGLVLSGSNVPGTKKLIGLLHPSELKYDDTFAINASTITGSNPTNFVLHVSSSLVSRWFSSSLIPTASNYIGKIFGSNPYNYIGAYNYILFDNFLSTYANGSTITATTIDLNLTGSLDFQYQPAETPWVVSQYVNGTGTQELFKFYTLPDGTNTNELYKISISNIKFGGELSGTNYGSFVVTIRDFNDTDKNQTVLEQFTCNLNPSDTNYIGKIIGDKYPVVQKVKTTSGIVTKVVYNGKYKNNSNYVRVEINKTVERASMDPSLVPFGFEGMLPPIANNTYSIPDLSYTKSQIYNSQYNNNVNFGFDFTNSDNYNYLNPIPNSITGTLTEASNFMLYNCIIHPSSSNSYAGKNIGYIVTGSGGGFTAIPTDARQFSLAFQGGFDGFNPAKPKYMEEDMQANNTMGFDLTNARSEGSLLYQQAIDILSNQDEYDIKLLCLPGVIASLHSSTVQYGIDMCENRGDVFYPFDIVDLTNGSMLAATNESSNFDSTYAGTYFPFCQEFDADLNKYVWCPPSIPMMYAFAFNDKFGNDWSAPAGLNRGGLANVTDIYYKLSHGERDDLYENKINALASFPGQGVVAWAQQTSASKSSALSSINVRRLLIAAKKYIASTTRYILFENNTDATRNKFLAIVNPYLDSIKQQQGLTAFKVVCDETNNPSAQIDRGILYAQIWLQPARAIDFIIVDMQISATGATFPS